MDQIKELALKLNYSYKDNVQKLKDAVLFVKEDGNDAPKMLTAHSIGTTTFLS